MQCSIKYKPIIWKTSQQDAEDLKMSFLTGDGQCPACKREGLDVMVEERYGETP